MGRIRVLDEKTVGMIAAGEVVERPASVVKELVENALDAGADAVSVELAGGGLARIVVSDNGCGMDADDAVLALTRHATSKIGGPADLEAIATLGFRGEALASIAQVSHLTIRTRLREAAEGILVESAGGQILRVRPVGCAAGTTVTVTDLFFNTPVRKKFLKGISFEGALAVETAARLALAAPGVRFSVAQNGRHVLSTPGRGNLFDAVCAVIGADTAAGMVEVDLTDMDLRVYGYVSRPALHRGSRRHQYFFVNGRPVRCYPLAATLEEAYGGLLPAGRHPVAVLHLETDPAALDVNVHPAKWEIRFRRQQAVVRAVGEAVRRALGRPAAAGPGRPDRSPAGGGAGKWAVADLLAFVTGPEAVCEEAAAFTALAETEVLGFLPPVYLVGKVAGGLAIIDQHAAHERVLYEDYRQRLAVRPPVQVLGPAVTLELGPADVRLLETYGTLLEAAGFIVESFGGRTFVLRGVPALPQVPAGENELRAFLDALDQEKPPDKAAFLDLMARTLACHRAVKAGQQLGTVEAQALLAALARTSSPYTCPHGRPTCVLITREELARRFLRA
ncbi:MAG: DNA mismatch repair endonuclease MutL [Bacillota bacterium]